MEALGYSVDGMEPDGWCLLSHVPKAALSVGDPAAVLKAAPRGGPPMAHLGACTPGACTRAAVQAEVDRRLQRSSITARSIGALCHSDLWDVLPPALSRVRAGGRCTSSQAMRARDGGSTSAS